MKIFFNLQMKKVNLFKSGESGKTKISILQQEDVLLSTLSLVDEFIIYKIYECGLYEN